MDQRPTLLCATGPFFMLPLRQAFEAISKAGFDGAEVMVTSERDSHTPALLRSLGEQNGVRVESIHAPFLLLTRRVFSTDPLEKTKRSVDLAQQVGAPLVVVHPAYRWQLRYAAWLEDELTGYTNREDIVIGVENMFPVWLRGRGVAFHRTVGIEDLRNFPTITLDTSHLAVSGIDIIRAYEELADRVVHIHLSNNLGTGRDTHSPLREGVLPIGAFLERLGATGYSGSITLEIDVRPWSTQPAKLASTLRENREYCLERLAASAGA